MGQERRRHAIVSWGFDKGGLCTCESYRFKLVGLDEDFSWTGKIFKNCVDIIVHLHNFFNSCLQIWNFFQACRKILARLHIFWVVVICAITVRRRDITVVIGGKFLVRALTFRWLGAVWKLIATPDGRWYGAFRGGLGGGLGGRLGRRGSAGSRWWVCIAHIVGWYCIRNFRVIGVKDDLADIQSGLIHPPWVFSTALVEVLEIVLTLHTMITEDYCMYIVTMGS